MHKRQILRKRVRYVFYIVLQYLTDHDIFAAKLMLVCEMILTVSTERFRTRIISVVLFFCQEMEEITCFLSFLTTLFALILTLFLFVHLTPLPRRLVYEKIFSYEFSLLWHFACTLKTKTYAVAKIKMEYRVPCKCDAHNFHSIIHTQLS